MNTKMILLLTTLGLGAMLLPACGETPGGGIADDHAGHAHDESEGAQGHEEHGDEEGHDARAGAEHEEAGEHVDEVTLTPQAIEQWDIQVQPASRQALTETFVAPARVSLNLERIAHVGAVVSGRVSELKARVGDQVKAGDMLMVIDSPELGQAQSDFLQKRIGVEVASATIDVARSAYERAQSLYEESRGLSFSEVQRREGEYKAAQAQVLAAKAAVQAAENTLHLLGMDQAAVQQLIETGEVDPRYRVRAPIDGEVIEREATLGESVGPDREALLVVADLSTLWVLADVPETRLGQVTPGGAAVVMTTTADDPTLQGTVEYVSPRVNPATRTVPVRVVIEGETNLRPGMFVSVELTSGAGSSTEPVLAVPETAVQTVEGGAAVFVPVPGEPNTFAKRAVRVGERVGRMLPVLDGLEEGEPFVASGSFILKADLGKASAAHEH